MAILAAIRKMAITIRGQGLADADQFAELEPATANRDVTGPENVPSDRWVHIGRSAHPAPIRKTPLTREQERAIFAAKEREVLGDFSQPPPGREHGRSEGMVLHTR